jgi:hypothetical protein
MPAVEGERSSPGAASASPAGRPESRSSVEQQQNFDLTNLVRTELEEAVRLEVAGIADQDVDPVELS